MRTACVLSLLLILAGSPVAAGEGTVTELMKAEFGSPASLLGNTTADRVGWAMFFTTSPDQLELTIHVPTESTYRDHRVYQPQVSNKFGTIGSMPDVETSSPPVDLHPGTLTLTIGNGELGSLLIMGDITTGVSSTGAQQATDVDDSFCLSTSADLPPGTARTIRQGGCPATPGAMFFTPGSEASALHSLVAENVSLVEWTGATVECVEVDPCPGGGDASSESFDVAGQATVVAGERHWSELRLAGADLGGSGSVSRAFVHGDQLDLAVDGRVELPSATVADCTHEGCPESGQTLQAEGDIILSDLGPAQDSNRLQATLSGSPSWLRVDEAYVDPSILFGPTAAAVTATTAAVGAALLYKFLAPLFTRMTSDQALEHPRRRLLYGFITDHPGTTFRELLRGTDVPAGTARHHLTIMTRTGLIVERRHKSTLRFFENHGRFDDPWDAVVLLREPELAQLHAWLKDHPACMQKDILTGMQGRGWQRSTTQHRLNRLVGGGLVTVRPQGRVKLYTAHDEVQQPVPEEAWLGSGSFRNGPVGTISRS